METGEWREKNDQDKAKQAEQWAYLIGQVRPLLLGNINTMVLFFFFFVFNMLGSIYYLIKDFFFYLVCCFIVLFTLCAFLMQAILLSLAFSESKFAQNGCLSLDPLSSSKHNNTA